MVSQCDVRALLNINLWQNKHNMLSFWQFQFHLLIVTKRWTEHLHLPLLTCIQLVLAHIVILHAYNPWTFFLMINQIDIVVNIQSILSVPFQNLFNLNPFLSLFFEFGNFVAKKHFFHNFACGKVKIFFLRIRKKNF